ncbi:MAG: hypothetical protein D6788_04925 [Planctomycetota bacterium]|nr:MAG: hypothetical protein D6788_04925 [Planctomycetota bacterium]
MAGIVVGIACLLAAAYGVVYLLEQSAAARWKRLAAMIRARGEPLTFADIEAQRPAADDRANGAPVVKQALALLDSITEPGERSVFVFDSQCRADFLRGLRRDCIPSSRLYVAAREPVLAKLAELERYPEIRFDLKWSDPPVAWKPLMDLMSGIRTLDALLAVDDTLDVVDGNVGGVVDGLEHRLRLSEALYREPSILPLLVGLALDHEALMILQGLLDSSVVTESDLARLQTAWDRHLQRQSLRWSLLGERASIVRQTNPGPTHADTRTSNAQPTSAWPAPQPFSLPPEERSPWSRWLLLENRIYMVTLLTEFLDNCSEPARLQERATELEEHLSRYSPTTTMARIVLPSLSRSFFLYTRLVERLRCASAALAAERFRLQRGRFPETREELVPAFLQAWPNDPTDGKPMRLTHTGLGLVIYAVGENRTDDGGEIFPEGSERLGRDSGFRLLPPDSRKLRYAEEEGGKGQPGE